MSGNAATDEQILKPTAEDQRLHKDPESAQEDEQPDEKPSKEWEKRGDNLALVIGCAMILWFQSVPLATMFGHAWYAIEKDAWFHCERGGHYQLSFVDACICGYTQGVTCCFAPLSFTILIMFIGRELLQKRIYYGLLKQHGVLQFASNNPLTDPLGVAVFVLYVHVVLYFIFIIYATDLFSQNSTSNLLQHATTGIGHGLGSDVVGGHGDFVVHDSAALAMVSELFAFYILPATLFIVFFYCGYDIEVTLVPLSQYVHDAHDAGEENQLSELKILDDKTCNRLVLAHAADILAKAGSHAEEFEQMIHWYVDKSKEFTDAAEGKLGLVDSLWPAQILLPRQAFPDTEAKKFRILYYVYFGSSLFFGTLVLVLLGHYIEFCFWLTVKGDIPHTIQMCIEIIVAAICTILLARLIQVTYTARHLKVSRKEQ